MNRFLLYSLVLAAMFYGTVAHAQTDYEWIEFELMTILSSSQYSKIESADKMMIKAGKLKHKAVKLNSKIIKFRDKAEVATTASKRRKYMVKVAGLENKYAELAAEEIGLTTGARKKLFLTYRSVVTDVRPRDRPEVIAVGRVIEKEAYSKLKKSQKQLRTAKREKVHNNRYAMYQEINIDHQKAVMSILHLYALYTQMIGLDPDDEFYGDFTFSFPEDKTKKRADSGTTAGGSTTTGETGDDSTVTGEVTVTDAPKRIVYKVQLIAVSEKMSDAKLSIIYSGGEKVHVFRETGLYKYMIGEFGSVVEAEAFRETIGITDSFVVAFRGNERVDID